MCPDRADLIHKNYRKLCNVLVDVEEWGQVIIIGMLTRYARTQFADPNANSTFVEEKDKPFYDESDEEKEFEPKTDSPTSLDPDHRLLLRHTKPLLHSRNASVRHYIKITYRNVINELSSMNQVVMAVAQLYHHLAPRADVPIVAKALIRLLRSHREVQIVVLNSIASMSVQRKVCMSMVELTLSALS